MVTDTKNDASSKLASTLRKMEPSVLAKHLTPAKRSAAHDLDSNSGDKKLKARPEPINEYRGWVVPAKNFKIPHVVLDETLTSEIFYQKYIKERRPIVIRGFLRDLIGLEKWRESNEHLKNRAGNEKVVVEVRSNSKDTFGRGNQTTMSFSDFLDLVERGDTMHYLTTQDVLADEGGRPDILAPFMKALQDDFPLCPSLMGNLIPSNINIWMGNSEDGASSGLHHDYHDNLYIVLRGRKRFRLYSPLDTEKMYTIGALEKVHPNGRINYQGERTTPYGADLKSDAAAAAARARENAEKMLVAAEQAVAKGRPGAQEELDRAEELMEIAMDQVLEAEMSDYEEGLEEDDFEGESDDEADDFSDDVKIPDYENGVVEMPSEKRRLVDKTVKNPNNFSRVGTHFLDDEAQIQANFPEFLEARSAFCNVKAGDMLYLPASWFHEVTSFGSGKDGHLAMNYWFHPPDAENCFVKPYSTDFWTNDFKQRFPRKKPTKFFKEL